VTAPALPLQLEEVLVLERIEECVFRGRTPPTHLLRVFGGQVAAQALSAACATVDTGRSVHSLHGYFVRRGDPERSIAYLVERVRDGGSFSTRRVVATQDGEAIFTLAASFQRHVDGLQHQTARLDAPAPDEVPGLDAQLVDAPEEVRTRYQQHAATFPVEMRFVDGLPTVEGRGRAPSSRQRVWLRAMRALPDDEALHRCALTYVSDLFLLSSTLAPHGLDTRQVDTLSLDHAVWFHGAFRVDEWLLYEQEGFWTGTGRGLARGQIFDVHGTLVATVMQEGLLSPRRAADASGVPTTPLESAGGPQVRSDPVMSDPTSTKD